MTIEFHSKALNFNDIDEFKNRDKDSEKIVICRMEKVKQFIVQQSLLISLYNRYAFNIDFFSIIKGNYLALEDSVPNTKYT